MRGGQRVLEVGFGRKDGEVGNEVEIFFSCFLVEKGEGEKKGEKVRLVML